MIYDNYENITIDAELDVKISVLPYRECYIDRIRSFDDRMEFIHTYEINKLDLNDRRLIKVHMTSDFPRSNNIGESGVRIKMTNGMDRVLSGERCNYIPYQLVKDCKDGDTFDYIIILPYRTFIKLHVTCQQDSYQYCGFTDNVICDMFKRFDNAISFCKSNRLAI